MDTEFTDPTGAPLSPPNPPAQDRKPEPPAAPNLTRQVCDLVSQHPLCMLGSAFALGWLCGRSRH